MTHFFFFSDKPHLLKVPQSPKIAPLSREHWFEIQAGISTGEHFRFKPHISCNHLQSPYSPLPEKEPLPSARLGRFHNGNLSRSLSLSLLQLWAPWAGRLCRVALEDLARCQSHSHMEWALPATPHTVLPMWVLMRRLLEPRCLLNS